MCSELFVNSVVGPFFFLIFAFCFCFLIDNLVSTPSRPATTAGPTKRRPRGLRPQRHAYSSRRCRRDRPSRLPSAAPSSAALGPVRFFDQAVAAGVIGTGTACARGLTPSRKAVRRHTFRKCRHVRSAPTPRDPPQSNGHESAPPATDRRTRSHLT